MNTIKRNLGTILVAIIFLIVIGLKFYSKIDDKIMLGLLASIASIYFGLLKYKVENDKIFKELFLYFNDKYDSKFNDLINELKNDDKRKLDRAEINLIIDYFNLCAEEFLWRQKGRIPKIVWTAWLAGINENIKIKQVRELLNNELASDNTRKSYYGLDKKLKLNHD